MYLTQALKRAVQTNRNGIATIFNDRKRTWSEFHSRIACLAGAFAKLGVKPGDRVAMLALNSDRYLEYYFAVWWAGGVVVPMNVRWSVPENVYSLDDSGAEILLVDDTFKAAGAPIHSQAKCVRHVIHAGDGPAPEGMLSYETLVAEGQPAPDAVRGMNDLAGIFYTGGTTGFPKGVMLSHLSLGSNALAVMAELDINADSIYLHAAPMFHLADGAGSLAASMAGATHTMIPMFNPEQVLKSIQRDRVTHVLLVPTMIKMVVDFPGIKDYDTSSLHRILYGASPIPESVLRDAIGKFPNTGFVQAFGQTELSPVCTVLPPQYHVLEGPRAGKLRSGGRATFGVEVKIADVDGQELPHGSVGEVWVRGPNTMLGYWNKPKETAAALVDGWVRTGDAAYMDDDGFVFVVDRLKDMIISGGENVYSAEVENAVTKHPAVSACAVIGVPDEAWGERVHAVVVLRPGAQATAQDIIDYCHTLIAGYKCPRSAEFVQELPLSAAGKLMKNKLREPYWQGHGRAIH